jgi:hypothetical protein
MAKEGAPEKVVQEIRRKTRRRFSAEEKIRIVLEGLRGEESIATLCRKEGLAPNLYYLYGLLLVCKKIRDRGLAGRLAHLYSASAGRQRLPERPNGTSARTRLNRWTALPATIIVRFRVRRSDLWCHCLDTSATVVEGSSRETTQPVDSTRLWPATPTGCARSCWPPPRSCDSCRVAPVGL